jgi:CHASE2 domain-containing sensor protein
MSQEQIPTEEQKVIEEPPPPADSGEAEALVHQSHSWHLSPLWRHLLKATPLILTVSLITFLLAHFGWLQIMETGGLDTLMRLRKPVKPRDVSIVKITEEDYEQIFESRYPLNPVKLKLLIDAIARGKPKLIAVDIDTSHPDFRSLQPDPKWPPIVWAQSVSLPKNSNEKLKPIPVLGGQDIRVPTGLAVLPNDSDGNIRHFRREFETTNGTLPTFPAAILATWREASAGHPRSHESALQESKAEEEEHNLVLDLTGEVFDFNPHKASDVLTVADGEGWQTDGPLKDQVVLLGGEYAAARDVYRTPLGEKYGVELMAHAVESELQGRTIAPVNEVLMILLEVAAGFLLVILNYYLGGTSWRWLTWAAIPLIALVSSFLVFSRLSLWASFVPVMVAGRLHAKLDRWWEKILEKVGLSHHPASEGREEHE